MGFPNNTAMKYFCLQLRTKDFLYYIAENVFTEQLLKIKVYMSLGRQPYIAYTHFPRPEFLLQNLRHNALKTNLSISTFCPLKA